MGLFRRFGDILSANLNELVDRFEDPEKMLRQAIREMEQAVGSAQQSAAKVIANEKLLARQLADHERQVQYWKDRARQAIQNEDDSQARQALIRKHEHHQLVAALEDQHGATAQAGRKLRRQIDGMRSKLAEAKRKLSTLCARQRATDARRKMLAVSSTELPETAFSKFERLDECVALAAYETDAFLDLVGIDEDMDNVNSPIDYEIDRELAELKNEAAAAAE